MLKAILLDLDGVVYRGRELVPGADRFVHWAETRGFQILYLTNRSGRAPTEICRHLGDIGIACQPERIITSALATARYLRHAEARRVAFLGGTGLAQALGESGFDLNAEEPDYFVVGGTPDLTPGDIVRATRCVLAGATLVATNQDRLVDSDSGPVPGNGATVAAIEYATEASAILVGKPEPHLVHMALKRLGIAPSEALLVGDSPETDIRAGIRAGVATVLLRTGVGSYLRRSMAGAVPDYEAANHDELRERVTSVLRRSRPESVR